MQEVVLFPSHTDRSQRKRRMHVLFLLIITWHYKEQMRMMMMMMILCPRGKGGKKIRGGTMEGDTSASVIEKMVSPKVRLRRSSSP